MMTGQRKRQINIKMLNTTLRGKIARKKHKLKWHSHSVLNTFRAFLSVILFFSPVNIRRGQSGKRQLTTGVECTLMKRGCTITEEKPSTSMTIIVRCHTVCLSSSSSSSTQQTIYERHNPVLMHTEHCHNCPLPFKLPCNIFVLLTGAAAAVHSLNPKQLLIIH